VNLAAGDLPAVIQACHEDFCSVWLDITGGGENIIGEWIEPCAVVSTCTATWPSGHCCGGRRLPWLCHAIDQFTTVLGVVAGR
jgi:hypothetical protein